MSGWNRRDQKHSPQTTITKKRVLWQRPTHREWHEAGPLFCRPGVTPEYFTGIYTYQNRIPGWHADQNLRRVTHLHYCRPADAPPREQMRFPLLPGGIGFAYRVADGLARAPNDVSSWTLRAARPIHSSFLFLCHFIIDCDARRRRHFSNDADARRITSHPRGAAQPKPVLKKYFDVGNRTDQIKNVISWNLRYRTRGIYWPEEDPASRRSSFWTMRLKTITARFGENSFNFSGPAVAAKNDLLTAYAQPCDSDSKKPGWAADSRSVCQSVYPIRQHRF